MILIRIGSGRHIYMMKKISWLDASINNVTRIQSTSCTGNTSLWGGGGFIPKKKKKDSGSDWIHFLLKAMNGML